MVQHVGEGAFRPQVNPLGDGKHLAESARKVYRPWTDDRANLSIAEAPYRIREWTSTATGSASGPWSPARIAGARQARGVGPKVASAIGGFGA